MVVSGKYSLVSEAHGAILKMVENKDAMLHDLDSLEIDDNLIMLRGKSVILMAFPDAIKFLHRIGVCTIDKDDVVPQIEVEVASDASVVSDVSLASVASDAVQGVASDAARPIAVKNDIRMSKVFASVLKTISGIEHLDDCPRDKELRQIKQGEIGAKGEDISGFWNLQDVGSAYIYEDSKNANRWAKGITTADASSLIKIPSGNPSVS